MVADADAVIRKVPKAERTAARAKLRAHGSPVVLDLGRVCARGGRVVAAMEQHSGVTCSVVEREDARRPVFDRHRMGPLAVVGVVALLTAGCVAVTLLEWSSIATHGWLTEGDGDRRLLHETSLELALGPTALALLSGTLGWWVPWRAGRKLRSGG